MIRLGAWVRRNVQRWLSRLPHFPDPNATCPAHGARYCRRCHRNPSTCDDSYDMGCGYWSETGMHWDTCPNRIR